MMGISEVKATPVLGLNLWEHAYWADHDGEAHGTYVDKFWSFIDWKKVSENFEKYNSEGYQVGPLKLYI